MNMVGWERQQMLLSARFFVVVWYNYFCKQCFRGPESNPASNAGCRQKRENVRYALIGIFLFFSLMGQHPHTPLTEPASLAVHRNRRFVWTGIRWKSASAWCVWRKNAALIIVPPARFSRSSQVTFLEKCKNHSCYSKEKCMEKREIRLIFLWICAILFLWLWMEGQ